MHTHNIMYRQNKMYIYRCKQYIPVYVAHGCVYSSKWRRHLYNPQTLEGHGWHGRRQQHPEGEAGQREFFCHGKIRYNSYNGSQYAMYEIHGNMFDYNR